VNIFLSPLLQHHFERHPLTLIDIGARGGLQANWAQARKHLRLIGLEPDSAEHARLAEAHRDGTTLYINAAAYSEATRLILNVGRVGGTSSIFEPNYAFLASFPDAERYDIVEKVSIRADALDHLLLEHAVEDVDFLKIDTQGAEAPILDGASNTLRESVIGVEVEVLFAPLYVGQSKFGDTDERLRQAGFQLFDLRPCYWKRVAGIRYGGPKGQLVFADALYLKTAAQIAAMLDKITTPQDRRAKLLRVLTICLLYGYVDYALELFQVHGGVLDPKDGAVVFAALTSETSLSYRIPQFRGRGWLSSLFYRLSFALRPAVGGWGTGARHLGNVD